MQSPSFPRRLAVCVAALLLVLVLSPCRVALQIPDGKIQEIAQTVLAVGHPTVLFKSARLVGASPGGCLSGEKPSLDVEITYRRMLGVKDHTMTTRFTVHSLKPCSVSPEVLSDTGPVPAVLLSEALLGPSVGLYICESLSDNSPSES